MAAAQPLPGISPESDPVTTKHSWQSTPASATKHARRFLLLLFWSSAHRPHRRFAQMFSLRVPIESSLINQ